MYLCITVHLRQLKNHKYRYLFRHLKKKLDQNACKVGDKKNH
jgi:hypothetical protein